MNPLWTPMKDEGSWMEMQERKRRAITGRTIFELWISATRGDEFRSSGDSWLVQSPADQAAWERFATILKERL